MLRRTPLNKGNKGLKRGNKPLRTQSPKTQEKNIERKDLKKKDYQFYESVWNDRKHFCENCGCSLGDEPLTIFFDHILEKSRYPEYRHKSWNIMLLCFQCHSKKTDGHTTPIMDEYKAKAQISAFWEKGSQL